MLIQPSSLHGSHFYAGYPSIDGTNKVSASTRNDKSKMQNKFFVPSFVSETIEFEDFSNILKLN